MPAFENSRQHSRKPLIAESMLLAGVAVALLLPGAAMSADQASERIIAECGVVNEVTLAECVTLKLEQAEATLLLAEENWQKLLEDGLLAEQTALEEPTESPVSNTVMLTEESSNVIAIVNDAALQTGLDTGANPVINVDADTGAEVVDEKDLFDTAVDIKERFGFLPALFRSYRDQRCAFQASMFADDRTRIYYQACLAAMSQVRSQELIHSLAVQRSNAKSGQYFRGYYTKIDTGALFQSCDRRTNWWVSGATSVLNVLDQRFEEIKSQSITNSDLLYAELRGTVARSSAETGANFSTTLTVRSVSLLRPVTDTDCEYRAQPGTLSFQNGYAVQNTADQSLVDSSNAATVDDYASSGFLYGYFNYWLAACSVTQSDVCSAETEAQFASDGNWQLRVDRSIEGDWRVKLVPTTDDQLIEKQLTMQINGADVFLGTDFPEPMSLAMNQGVEIANGELARELVAKLKSGRELRLQWFDDFNVMSELKFSLLGITRALEYFDNAKS